MITAPNGWDDIWSTGDYRLDIHIDVYLTGNIIATYGNDNLSSCSISGALFSDFSFGNACSAQLRFTLIDASEDIYQFRKNQKILLRVRLQQLSGGEPTSTYSGYAQLGKYYIDSYILSESGSISVVAYDVLNLMQDMVSQQEQDMAFETYMSQIRAMYGQSGYILSVSDYTNLRNTKINRYASGVQTIADVIIPQAAADKPAREMLASVAGICGGNVIVMRDGTFKMIRGLPAPYESTSVASDAIRTSAAQLSYEKQLKTVSCAGVDSGGRFYQNSSGWAAVSNISDIFTITTSADNSTYNTVAAVESSMHITPDNQSYRYNLQYTNIRASGVYITPLFELGDVASINIGNGKYYNFPIAQYDVNLVAGCWGTLSFPITDNAFVYRTADEWSESGGWIGSWFDVQLSATDKIANPTIEVISSHMFALKRVLLANTPNVVSINNGSLTVVPTITYKDDNDETQTARLYGQLAEQYYPVTRPESSSSTVRIIDYIYFYSSNIPASAVGKTSLTSTLKIKTSDSTSTDGTLITIKGIR